MPASDKVLAKFVRDALMRKASVGVPSIKQAIGYSKIVTNPNEHFMADPEIDCDLGEFNHWRERNHKQTVKIEQVKHLARNMQQDHYSAKAKQEEARMHKEEERRREKEVKKHSAQLARQSAIEEKRELATRRLNQNVKKNILKDHLETDNGPGDMVID